MRAVRLVLLCCLLVSVIPAQQAARQGRAFRGKVVRVDSGGKHLTVANDPIEGGMGAMTMEYSVDRPEVIERIKPGDRITATYYDGDTTLHSVQVVAPQMAPGGNTGSLRLEDLEQMALTGNPTIAQAQANVQVAAGLVKQAGLYPNPTVGYYGDEIRGGSFHGGKEGGFVSQTIVTGGKLRAARRVAEIDASEAGTSGDLARVRLLNNVRTVFYQLLTAQRLVEVRQNLAKLASGATDTSRQLGNIGQADRPDILQAEVEQQQAQVSLNQAQQYLRSSWRMLAAVVGKPGLPLARLEGDLDEVPELNYEEALGAVLRDSPEVKLAQQAVDRAEASLVVAKKAPIPDVQIMGTLAQDNEPLGAMGTASGIVGSAQIGITLPLFNRNQGNIAAAKGEIESAKQDLVRVKLELERGIAGIFRDYDSARVTVRQYKEEMLPRAEQAYNMYRVNYRNMAGAYPQVLISQRTLFQLQADYVQALGSAWQSALAIRGFGLMDGLARPR